MSLGQTQTNTQTDIHTHTHTHMHTFMQTHIPTREPQQFQETRYTGLWPRECDLKILSTHEVSHFYLTSYVYSTRPVIDRSHPCLTLPWYAQCICLMLVSLKNKIDTCLHVLITFLILCTGGWYWWSGQGISSDKIFAAISQIATKYLIRHILNHCIRVGIFRHILNHCIRVGILSKFFVLKSGTSGLRSVLMWNVHVVPNR